MVQIHPFEDENLLCPFQIQMCDKAGGFSLGTAFFYQFENETFIITNWHNVTGKDPISGESLHFERSPLYIQAKWPVVNPDSNYGDGLKAVRFEVQVVEFEDSNDPIWFEHPTLGSLCDVVAIPAKRPDHWPSKVHRPANTLDETPIPVSPGLKVMVIGFPRGISSGPGLPLVKTGFLSSEPRYNVRIGGEFSDIGGMRGAIELPAMFLDVHTLPGMSGSPVFGEYTGWYNPDYADGSFITGNSWLGTGQLFLGCHSSRTGEREERAGLGICYKADAIKEICRAKHRGSRFPRSFGDTGYTYT